MMKITTRKSGDVTILDLEGKLTIGVGDYPLRDAVRTALSDGVRKILLHLEKVTMVDSTGVGELVSSYTSASHRGSKVKLLKPSSKHVLASSSRRHSSQVRLKPRERNR